jgi:probable phosphoglycerate mutase
MQTLYVIRHGETDFNAKNIVQGGGIDSDLNERGMAQAEAFFRRYRNIHFEAVYCSSLKRTYQTVQNFKFLCDIRYHPGLNELSWGVIEGKENTPEIKSVFSEILHAWKNGDLNRKMEGGESPIQVWVRVESALKDILRTHSKGNILICTHGRTLRIMLSMLLGYGLENMHLFQHDNTGLNLLHHQGNMLFYADKINDVSHLEGF